MISIEKIAEIVIAGVVIAIILRTVLKKEPA